MKKIILAFLVFELSLPVMADILLSPTEEAQLKQEYEEGQLKCPKDKPLYDGTNCYSCDEPKNLVGKYLAGECEKLCPNRYKRYECGTRCILKNPPDKNYNYIRCQGWIKEE